MERQCAWCLCLINNVGERLSPTPLPKLYEASHGICSVCGTQWMEQAIVQERAKALTGRKEAGEHTIQSPHLPQRACTPDITELVLQLQQEIRPVPGTTQVARKKSLRPT